MSEINQSYIDLVVAGFNAEKSDDDILKELFQAGVSFNDLRSTFNTIVSEQGLRLSAKESKVKTAELLTGWMPNTTEEMQAKVTELQTALGVTATKAMSAMKSWAKTNDIELPKAPRKRTERKTGFSGHFKKILDTVMENRSMTKEQIAAFCAEHGIPATYATTAANIVAFAKEWNGEVSEDIAEAA